MAHPTIRRGSTGSAVVELQGLLTSLGYYHGSIDGIYGPQTQLAVIAFQRDHGLVQDGVVGPKTWAALDATKCGHGHPTCGHGHPTLRVGSRGPAVQELQTKLKAQGYYCGAIDGIYGPQTQQAVIAYQRAHCLTPDGIVGPKTWASLDAPCPAPAPQNQKPTIRCGSTGWAVVDLQELLILLCYYRGPLNGKFGEETSQAVKKFQHDHHLAPDGIVGPKTWAALEADEACIPPTRAGDRSPNVAILQMKLQILGYYAGPIYPVFDAATKKAVLAFQCDHHLAQDGIVGPHTWKKLIHDTDILPTLRTGSKCPDVRNLQKKLRLLGYYNGPIDSIFGEETRKAVVAFQCKHDLAQDGVVGPNTWAELEITAPKYRPAPRECDRGPAPYGYR